MSQFAKRALPFGILFLLLAAPALIHAQSSRIQGHVFGVNRRPVADAYIELLNEVESVISRTKTDGGGGYYFTGLSAGRYQVRVRPFGTIYEEQAQEVELVTFVGGRQVADSQIRDFYLRERKSGSRQPGAPGVVFAQDVPPDAQKAYDRAVSNINTDRPDLGIQDLRSAIEIFPTYFLALDLLGVELLKQQRFADAVPFFERAIAVNPRSSNSWYGIAFCYYGLDQGGKAVEASKQAAALNPESTDIALMLGISLRKNRQFNEAEKALLKAKKLSDGKSPDVLWNLALLYAHNLKNYRLAAEELENYLKIKPDHPNAQLLKKLISQYRLQS
jgi:tetratricopeptide (TPR) repeat protein